MILREKIIDGRNARGFCTKKKRDFTPFGSDMDSKGHKVFKQRVIKTVNKMISMYGCSLISSRRYKKKLL